MTTNPNDLITQAREAGTTCMTPAQFMDIVCPLIPKLADALESSLELCERVANKRQAWERSSEQMEYERDEALLRVRRQRRFPIMSDVGEPRKTRRSHAPIPWAVAERAYAAYSARYGNDQTLERMAERGGFGCGEMDMLAPGWEEECSEIVRLERELDKAQAESVSLRESLEQMKSDRMFDMLGNT